MLYKKIFIGIASIAILAGLIIGCGTVSADDAYVTLDINPSIDLTVNGKDKVIDANALNEDGELLLLELDLVGENVDDAIALIIDEAINLGFIDIESAETLVSVSAISTTAELGETVRNKIMEHVNNAFKDRGMMGKAVEKAFDGSTVALAGALGVSPAQYNLAMKACELVDDIAIEDAVELTPEELMAMIRTRNQENKDVSQELKDEFQTARALLQDEYMPQIQELEDEIAVLEGEGGDTAAIEAELAALKDEFHAALEELRDQYHTDSVELREQMRTTYNARVSEHAAAVEAWRNQTQERKNDLEDDIDDYQHNTQTTPPVTTQENTATSGTGGNG